MYLVTKQLMCQLLKGSKITLLLSMTAIVSY
jgi:hypothetical protein